MSVLLTKRRVDAPSPTLPLLRREIRCWRRHVVLDFHSELDHLPSRTFRIFRNRQDLELFFFRSKRMGRNLASLGTPILDLSTGLNIVLGTPSMFLIANVLLAASYITLAIDVEGRERVSRDTRCRRRADVHQRHAIGGLQDDGSLIGRGAGVCHDLSLCQRRSQTQQGQAAGNTDCKTYVRDTGDEWTLAAGRAP